MSKKWSVQSEDDKYKVLVSDKASRKDIEAGTPRTDFLIIDKETHEEAHLSASSEEPVVTMWHDMEPQAK